MQARRSSRGRSASPPLRNTHLSVTPTSAEATIVLAVPAQSGRKSPFIARRQGWGASHWSMPPRQRATPCISSVRDSAPRSGFANPVDHIIICRGSGWCRDTPDIANCGYLFGNRIVLSSVTQKTSGRIHYFSTNPSSFGMNFKAAMMTKRLMHRALFFRARTGPCIVCPASMRPAGAGQNWVRLLPDFAMCSAPFPDCG